MHSEHEWLDLIQAGEYLSPQLSQIVDFKIVIPKNTSFSFIQLHFFWNKSNQKHIDLQILMNSIIWII